MKMIFKKKHEEVKEIINPYDNLKPFIKKDDYHKFKPLIKVVNLTQGFKKKRKMVNIFEDVNFEIFENECVAFLGPNGAGKTSTVAILSGINKPKSGDIQYLFKYDKTPYEELSVQFQDLQFPNSLTPRDLIEFSIELSNNSIDKDEYNHALNIFEIDRIIDTKMSKLSGGQQQRINVFIAMLSKPKILFLDEFTTGLDIAIKSRIQTYIKKFCKKHHITLVLISHDIDTIEELAERVIILANKQIMLDAQVKDINKKFGSVKKMLKKYIII